MTHSETKQMIRKLKVILVMVFLIFGCSVGRMFLGPVVETSITDAERVTSLDSQISSTQKELENLQYTIDNSGKEFIDLASNKDNYVKALGLLCDANQLNIHKMTVGDLVAEDGGLSTMSVVLELQGSLDEVKNFVNDIYSSEMLCRINSISYRLQNSTFSWMWRNIDENDVVSWWDISSVDGYLLEDPDEVDDKEDWDLLDANAFMKHGTALCYLEVQFIGTEG